MSSLNVNVTLSRHTVASGVYQDEPLYALVDIAPGATPLTPQRSPLNVVLVVDSSATMHHFQLTDEEREYWLSVAISRDEMERGKADESEAIYWAGQTLAEMQSVARKPMGIVVEAIKSLLVNLQPSDHVSVVAFADRVHPVFAAQDWVNFPDHCLLQMDLLREQRLPADIGTGTYMAEALRAGGDMLKQNALPGSINRLIVISDGIVQDADVTLLNVTALQDEGWAITTIGVGEDFDEEFLTRIADNSRGEYYYAADAAEIIERLDQEMTTLETTSITDLYIAIRGLHGAVVQDIYQVRPTMSLFDEVYTEDGWLRTRIGDVSTSAPASVLAQIAPPVLQAGSHALAEAQVTWTGTGGAGIEKIPINLLVTDDPTAVSEPDPAVQSLVDRFSIYKFEREAQRAQERGDLERAKDKLGAATRELHKIGEEQLARDMEEQIAALGQAVADPSRVKRIKATTRRLGSAPTEAP